MVLNLLAIVKKLALVRLLSLQYRILRSALMSVCTNAPSVDGVSAEKEKDAEEDFLIVKGVKVPRVRGGKRWEEHSKNSQKKIIALYYKKAFRKHQKQLERQEAVGPSVPEECKKTRMQPVKNSTAKIAQTEDKFPDKIKVVIDCGYVNIMMAKEVCKLVTQIGRSYGINKKMGQPFQLYLSRLSKDGVVVQECQRQLMGFDSFPIIQLEEHPCELFDCNKLIYLTPDAKEELLTLEQDKVYIIGGLVDEQINKRVCLEHARSKKIATAKLPIKRFMVNPSPKHSANMILTINQVMEVLTMIRHGHQWPQALAECIPKRKGLVVKDEYIALNS